MEIIAHRGAHDAKIRENTMAAFQKAVDLGCSMLELDCCLTSDNRLVVTHGGWTGYKDKIVFIKDYTLEELVSMGIVADSQKNSTNPQWQMPTFELVLNNFLGKIKINVELKEEMSQLVLHSILVSGESNGLWSEDDIVKGLMVSSFIFKEVAAFKGFCPGIKTAVTWGESNFFSGLKTCLLSRKMSKHKIEGIDMKRLFATKKIVAYFKKRKFAVRVYLVNDFRLIRKFFEYGVDGIFTDRAEIMMKELESIQPRTA